MKDTLVYVITFVNVPCAPVGPPPQATPSPTTTYFCTIMNFVDADTGKMLYAVESPEP
jgi:hypothetical protein